MQPGYRQPAAGERWNVNMPAVIGVVFVFLIAVVVWVIASSGGDDGDADDALSAPDPTADTSAAGSTAPTAPAVSSVPDTAVTGTTTPAPMPATTTPTTAPPTTTPATTAPPSTAAPTTEPPPATATPATTAPGAAEDTVPGDLGVAGRPMQRPPCDEVFITVLASPIGAQATAESVGAVLDQYPDSNYLRTDETCPSLTPASDGEPIYVVYFGPFAFESDACTARADGPDGAYARRLSNDVSPDHVVDCS